MIFLEGASSSYSKNKTKLLNKKLAFAITSFNMFRFKVVAVIIVVYSIEVTYFFLFHKILHFHHLRQAACTAKIKANSQIES